MSVFLDAMRAYPDLLSASGVVGSIIYISGFALVQSGSTCGNGSFYSASKVIAAIMVLISLVGAFNLGAFIIQVGFIVFGMVGLLRQFVHMRCGAGRPISNVGPDCLATAPDACRQSRPIGSLVQDRGLCPGEISDVASGHSPYERQAINHMDVLRL